MGAVVEDNVPKALAEIFMKYRIPVNELPSLMTEMTVFITERDYEVKMSGFNLAADKAREAIDSIFRGKADVVGNDTPADIPAEAEA